MLLENNQKSKGYRCHNIEVVLTMTRLMKRQDREWRNVPAIRYGLEKLKFWKDELGE